MKDEIHYGTSILGPAWEAETERRRRAARDRRIRCAIAFGSGFVGAALLAWLR